MRLGDPAPDAANFNFQVLVTMSNVLHLVNPSRLPLFAFSWLELASHRLLLPRLLSAPHQAVRDATAYRWGEAPTLLWGPLVASHFLRHPACSVRVCSLIRPVTLLALCVWSCTPPPSRCPWRCCFSFPVCVWSYNPSSPSLSPLPPLPLALFAGLALRPSPGGGLATLPVRLVAVMRSCTWGHAKCVGRGEPTVCTTPTSV